jgi:hypothetical protein
MDCGDFFNSQFMPIQMVQISMMKPSQNGQKPLPGVPVSSKPILEKRGMLGFQAGGSPLFHMRYTEKIPNKNAVTISARRMS